MADLDAADALIRHCREHGITLLYDLDDDLRHIPRDHPDAQLLRPRARLVSRLVRGADAVWVSTPALAATLAELRDDVRVVENGLDERLWTAGAAAPPRQGPVRILFMGTATHDADFAIVEGALGATEVGVRRACVGRTARRQQPRRSAVLGEPYRHAGATPRASYPGFVNWITQQHWDIGIAPLADTPFNRCKSAIKTLDYAALGLPVLASDRAVYRGTLADGPGGWLVPDDENAWFVALASLVRDARLRRRLSDGARAAFAAGTLAAQAASRRAAWLGLVRKKQRSKREAVRGGVAGITIRFPGATGGARDRFSDANAPPEETAMIKIRNLAALLALSGVAVLPACSMFGGDSSSRSSRASYSSQSYAAAPNYNSTSPWRRRPN